MPRGILTEDQKQARAQRKVDEIKYNKIIRRLADTTKDIKLASAISLLLTATERSTSTDSGSTSESTGKKRGRPAGSKNKSSSSSKESKPKGHTETVASKIPTVKRSSGEMDQETQYLFLIDQEGYFWVAYKPLTVVSYANLAGPYDEKAAREFVQNHRKSINSVMAEGMPKLTLVQILIHKIVEEFDDNDEIAKEIWSQQIQ